MSRTKTTAPFINHVTGANDGITLTAYRGDGSVLLGFDLDQKLAEHLAGFAISFQAPGATPEFLPNRLSFAQALTAHTAPSQHVWTPSNVAPFQKFRWLHVPSSVVPGSYTYQVTAMYFQADGSLKTGPTTSASLEIVPRDFGKFAMGFTRGMLSSQAYAEEFNNAPIRPADTSSIDYDTTEFAARYAWLGYHARSLLFDFLGECEADPDVTVDAFTFDLDEPDVIRALAKLKGRLRLIQDNSAEHVGPKAREPKAEAVLIASAGADHVKLGHFSRFSHSKVLIQYRGGKAAKVLTGSANFSVRGLYVQANNVLVFDDPDVAALYAGVFAEAWKDDVKTAPFARSGAAAGWFPIAEPQVPSAAVAFSPHETADVSLKKVADAIAGASSSVLFAVMELQGGGDVLSDLRTLSKRDIFSYGVTQSDAADVTINAPSSDSHGVLVPFSFLKAQAPEPFRAEISGGMGQVIHHKFVVVDFNGPDPVVFAGSSNLSSGGEVANGDNLLAVSDRSVATAYAVEAVRLVDHFLFRAAQSTSTSSSPLQLKDDSAGWWKPYYQDGSLKQTERLLFVK